jgi:hypothetical protein
VQAARPGENGEVSFYMGTTNKIMRGTFAFFFLRTWGTFAEDNKNSKRIKLVRPIRLSRSPINQDLPNLVYGVAAQ